MCLVRFEGERRFQDDGFEMPKGSRRNRGRGEGEGGALGRVGEGKEGGGERGGSLRKKEMQFMYIY